MALGYQKSTNEERFLTDKKISTSFEKTLAEVREAFKIMNDPTLCVFGCKRWITEGARSYRESSPEEDGICQKCFNKRYHKETYNERK